MTLDFSAHCDEIVRQTELLAHHLDGADTTVPVPSCPGWNVGQLARHVGGGHRWSARVLATPDARPVPNQFGDLSAYTHEDPDLLQPWLVEGADLLADALRSAGPGAPAWSPVPDGPQVSDFHARRMAHETALHRSDAALALGRDYTLAPDVAADAMDEWLTLGALPAMLAAKPHLRELLGPGRTVHLHATDVAAEAHAEWVVDLTGETLAWRRSHEKCAVAVRGPLTELLLVVYRRRSRAQADVEVLGDAGLLDRWLDAVAFG